MGTKKKLDGVVDIQLNIDNRKQFRINNDDKRIIELDISDFGILNRLRESYPRLQELGVKGFEFDEDDENIKLGEFMDSLNAINDEMISIIDYIFDSKVAKICANDKPLYNMVAGKFVFEIILDALFNLYSDNIRTELGQMSQRMKAHTDKYTGN